MYFSSGGVVSYGHSNSSLDEILKCDYFSVVLFIMLDKVVLSLDTILKCSHSSERY